MDLLWGLEPPVCDEFSMEHGVNYQSIGRYIEGEDQRPRWQFLLLRAGWGETSEKSPVFNGFAFDFLSNDARVYPFHDCGYSCLGRERDLVKSLTP